VRTGRHVRLPAVTEKTCNFDVFVDGVPKIDAGANIKLQELRTTLCPAQRTGFGPNLEGRFINQLEITGKVITIRVKGNLNVYWSCWSNNVASAISTSWVEVESSYFTSPTAKWQLKIMEKIERGKARRRDGNDNGWKNRWVRFLAAGGFILLRRGK
jgi:hypothetical protein